MDSGKTMLLPVTSDENIHTLREFRSILQSTIGPSGTCKLVVTRGGHLELSSSSQTLLKRLEFENPICRYIAQVSAGLPDYGLYFSVFVSHLVELQWSCKMVPKHKLQNIMSSLSQTVQKLLTSEQVCIKVDLGSISSFLPVVKTSLTSKCATLCYNLDFEKLVFEIVKLFLNCLDEQTNTIGRMFVKAESGPSHISSHHGLLYQLTEDSSLKIINNLDVSNIKILVFTMKLEETEESSLSKLKLLLEKAINSNVRIVACQKTVCAEIKLYLLRRDILLLERMGTDLTNELVLMSQAFPISQPDIGKWDSSKVVGSLSSVRVLKFNENKYVLLENEEMPVGTLLVQSLSLAGADHVKVLVQQAIGTLRSLAVQPHLTPGGGCLEVWIIAQLSNLKEQSTDTDTIRVLSWIQRALLSSCGGVAPHTLDSVFHHGWAEEEKVKCECGLVSRKHLEESDGQLIFLSEVISETSRQKLNAPKQPSVILNSDVLVECHQQKVNVILTALETFATLSDLGLIIYKG